MDCSEMPALWDYAISQMTKAVSHTSVKSSDTNQCEIAFRWISQNFMNEKWNQWFR